MTFQEKTFRLYAQILFVHFPPQIWIGKDVTKLSAQRLQIAERNKSDAGFLDNSAFSRSCVTDDRQATGKPCESAAPPKIKAAADASMTSESLKMRVTSAGSHNPRLQISIRVPLKARSISSLASEVPRPTKMTRN